MPEAGGAGVGQDQLAPVGPAHRSSLDKRASTSSSGSSHLRQHKRSSLAASATTPGAPDGGDRPHRNSHKGDSQNIEECSKARGGEAARSVAGKERGDGDGSSSLSAPRNHLRERDQHGKSNSDNWGGTHGADSDSRDGSLITASTTRSKNQMRSIPASLTDDERMTMLRHVRPSVFAETRAGRLGSAAGRPRSAAEALSAQRRSGIVDVNGHHHRRHISTAGRRSREGEAGRREGKRSASDAMTCKRTGILVEDGWVENENWLRASMSSAPSSAPEGGRRRGWSGGGSGGRRWSGGGGGGVSEGGSRAPSFVHSVAFGLNMGMLEALSGTTVSAAAAAAFASASELAPTSVLSASSEVKHNTPNPPVLSGAPRGGPIGRWD